MNSSNGQSRYQPLPWFVLPLAAAAMALAGTLMVPLRIGLAQSLPGVASGQVGEPAPLPPLQAAPVPPMPVPTNTVPTNIVPTTIVPTTNLPTTPAAVTSDHEWPAGGGEVIPAAATAPTMLPALGNVAAAVSDPPAPQVRLQVRVPAAAAPAKEVVYVILVQNVSAAPAHSVTVRNPLPPQAEFVAADPPPEKTAANGLLIWKFGTLPPGERRTIRLTLRPKPDATEIRNLAYVSYEYGQAVTTRIRPPRLQISKTMPPQVVRDEPFTVRLLIANTSPVVVENVRVVENLPASAEVEPTTPGGQRTAAAAPTSQQWSWDIPRLLPGQRHLIEYRVIPREAKDVLALTHVSAAGGIHDKAEGKSVVLVPGLAVRLSGPPGNAPVPPGEAARLEILVRNSGTLPATQIRVSGSIPSGCKPVRKTEGGQISRDTIEWFIPHLPPGEARTFRYELKAAQTARHTITATAIDSRGSRATDQLAVLFQAPSALSWETILEPPTLAVGRQGTFRICVRNSGGDAARNVRLSVTLPPAVRFLHASPNVSPNGQTLTFGPDTIAPRSEINYLITFEAQQAAQAWFRALLTADGVADPPMQADKAIEIIGGPPVSPSR